jgi:hypothetical protein
VGADWLERHTARAPAALRDRVRAHLADSGAVPEVGQPAGLARAGHQALARVLADGSDRSVALDLLAADALVTLALLAQAQASPERLGEFAAAVLRDVSAAA